MKLFNIFKLPGFSLKMGSCWGKVSKYIRVVWSVMQCVAVCCSVLHYCAVCCSVLCSFLQCEIGFKIIPCYWVWFLKNIHFVETTCLNVFILMGRVSKYVHDVWIVFSNIFMLLSIEFQTAFIQSSRLSEHAHAAGRECANRFILLKLVMSRINK